jgi:O-antigen ligase
VRARPSSEIRSAEEPPPSGAEPRQTPWQRLAWYGALAFAASVPISPAATRVAIGACAVGLVGQAAARTLRVTRTGLELPILGVVAAGGVSIAAAYALGVHQHGVHRAVAQTLSLVAPVVLAWSVTAHRGATADGVRRRALLLVATWSLAAVLPSALAWAQVWTGLDPLFALGLRSAPVKPQTPVWPTHFAGFGFFRSYMTLAHNLLPPFCVALAAALHRGVPRNLRAAAAVGAVATGLAVGLTLSRAAVVTLVCAVVAIPLLTAARWRIAAGLGVAAALVVALHPGVRTRFLSLPEGHSFADRALIWRVCSDVIRDHPAVGVGWGNYPPVSKPYWARRAPEFELHAWCHDSFLTAWAEGGALFFLAVAVWWAALARAGWRWWRSDDPLVHALSAGLLAAVGAMFANALVHDVMYDSTGFAGLQFAIGVVAAAAAATRPRQSRSSVA